MESLRLFFLMMFTLVQLVQAKNLVEITILIPRQSEGSGKVFVSQSDPSTSLSKHKFYKEVVHRSDSEHENPENRNMSSRNDHRDIVEEIGAIEYGGPNIQTSEFLSEPKYALLHSEGEFNVARMREHCQYLGRDLPIPRSHQDIKDLLFLAKPHDQLGGKLIMTGLKSQNGDIFYSDGTNFTLVEKHIVWIDGEVLLWEVPQIPELRPFADANGLALTTPPDYNYVYKEEMGVNNICESEKYV